MTILNCYAHFQGSRWWNLFKSFALFGIRKRHCPENSFFFFMTELRVVCRKQDNTFRANFNDKNSTIL